MFLAISAISSSRLHRRTGETGCLRGWNRVSSPGDGASASAVGGMETTTLTASARAARTDGLVREVNYINKM